MLNHYKFTLGSTEHRIKTFGDLVSLSTHTPFEGISLDWVRHVLEQQEIELIPIPDEEQSFFYGDAIYRIVWRNEQVLFIEKTEDLETKEITWRDLPEAVRRVL